MANNTVNKLRQVCFSQENYTKSVSENKAQFFSDIVDERFEFASDLMPIEEQIENGGTLYRPIKVRVIKGATDGLTENFANEIKKFIFNPYNYPQYLGKMYKYDNAVWLTTNMNYTTQASSHSLVRKCNNFLKWIDKNEILHTWECVFSKEFNSTNFKMGSEGVPQINAKTMVMVQQNQYTKNIPYNQRFIFNGKAYQTTAINNHLSETYMTLEIETTQIQNGDDLINNIANASGLEPTTTEQKILPQTVKILQGKTQAYNVYNYISGIKNSDTFTVTASQAPTVNYILTIIDGNNYSIQNIAQTPIPLQIECKNDTSQETTKMIIKLAGVF